MKYYQQAISDISKSLKTDIKRGLSEKQIEINRNKYGSNKIEKKDESTWFKLLLKQFDSVLVYVLIFALVLSTAAGEYLDSIVIALVIIVNSLLGFLQEKKASNTIAQLKKLTARKSKVIRNGKLVEIDSAELVVGDLIVLEEGAVVGADARIIETYNLFSDESSLTGESLPSQKNSKQIESEVEIGNQSNMVFSSSQITRGKGLAIVTAIGEKTQIGKIVSLVSEIKREKTSLEKKIDVLATFITKTIALLIFIIFIINVIIDPSLLQPLFNLDWAGLIVSMKTLFLTLIALAVASIPSGLPAVLTITLAIGIKRMAKENALISNLPSVETLGETNIICTDKTGTLTLNQMTVTNIYTNNEDIEISGQGMETIGKFSIKGKEISNLNSISKILEIGYYCNGSEISNKQIIGDPTEKALLISALKSNLEFKDKTVVSEIPFDSNRKMMSVAFKSRGQIETLSKGAPEIIIEKCSQILIEGKVRKITEKDIKKIKEKVVNYSNHALRVLGFAYGVSDSIDERNLIFVGLQAMIDPARKEVIEAVKTNKAAGIRTIMITGDHIITASAIAKKIGLRSNAMHGIDFAKLNKRERLKALKKIDVFARVEPEHKLLIVESLKSKDNVVAMTGDGVNDAPALKKADIGIAMAITGTEVAKESSDMILLDDNYATITSAVREGRTIYSNLKKFIHWLLAANLGEVLTILFALLVNIKVPFNAIQILWLNLVTDSIPALAIGLDSGSKNIMKQKPVGKHDKLIDKKMAYSILGVSCVLSIGTLAVYSMYLQNYILASTMALTTMISMQFWQIFHIRKIYDRAILSNKYLTGAIIISSLLQIILIYTSIGKYFDLTAIGVNDWLIVIVAGFIGLLISEYVVFKLINRFIKE